MPVKSGDLVGFHRSLTHTHTHRQENIGLLSLSKSLKFKLSQAITLNRWCHGMYFLSKYPQTYIINFRACAHSVDMCSIIAVFRNPYDLSSNLTSTRENKTVQYGRYTSEGWMDAVSDTNLKSSKKS